MNRKQFGNLVACMQKEACELSLRLVFKSRGKYEYICIRDPLAYCIDWEIRRRIRGTLRYSLYALHDTDHKAWTVCEGNNYHVYTDTELERWLTK